MAEEKRYKDQENIPMTEDEINQMIKSGQDRAYNNFEEESWDLARITSEEFKKHMEACDEEDDLHKYLVNGARLTCTQVTYEPFRIPEVGDFYVEEIPDMTKHLYTELNVSENPMGINGQPYATVNDTVKGTNILPFTGNCRVPANDSEKETIMIQLEYGIRRDGTRKQPGVNGVCECLMQLNEQWDNMFFADGKDHCMDRVDIDTEGKMESAKGITRTSVLFCKHGGLIVPVTSGQDVVKEEIVINADTVFALACTLSGDHMGTLSWEQKKANAEYIYNYLYEKNWSKESICGLLGNAYRECKMNPGVWHDWDNPNSAYGIAQWTKGDFLIYYNLSKEDVDRMAAEDPIKLMNNQLDYLIESMKPEYRIWGTGNRQKQYDKYPPSEGVPLSMSGEEYTQSSFAPKDMALVFHASYERSGDGVKELQERIDAAEQWYRYFSGEDVNEDDFP